MHVACMLLRGMAWLDFVNGCRAGMHATIHAVEFQWSPIKQLHPLLVWLCFQRELYRKQSPILKIEIDDQKSLRTQVCFRIHPFHAVLHC